MSLEILPSSEVSSSTSVTVRETTLRPGDSLVITTDTHLSEIDLKLSDLVAEDVAIKEKINEISTKLINALNGVRLVGICPNTKEEVLANKQLLTDFVNSRFTEPDQQLKGGDVVSTTDKFTFVYLSDGAGAFSWQQYNAAGDVGDMLSRLDELERSKTEIERKITTLETFKDAQIVKNSELEAKISDLENADSDIVSKIGDLQGAGYTSTNAGSMFREIKTGLENLNSRTDASIRELVLRLNSFTTDITAQVQTAENQAIQSSYKSEANVTAIEEIKNSVRDLVAKDEELSNAIGTLSNLQTGNRNSLVLAINEVFGMVNALTGGSTGGGIEATVLRLSNAMGSIDTLGGETIVSALEKLSNAINLKASTEALTLIVDKIGSASINGELSQNVVEALNDLLVKIRDVDNKLSGYLPLTGGSVTGALTYSNVDSFTSKQAPHVEWVENKINTIVGEMSTIGTTEFSTIAGSIREVNGLVKTLETGLTEAKVLIGDLSDSGYSDNLSVVACLKEIKGITDSIVSDNTSTKQRVSDLEANKADKTAVDAINEKLSLMEGASVVIDIISETKDEVEGQSDKDSFLAGKVTDAGKLTVEEGYEIRTSDGYSYIYKNGQWKLSSLPPVAIATDSSAGIVKFKDEEGYVTGSTASDGTMVLKGFTDLKDRVNAAETSLATKVEEAVYTAKVTALETSITANGQLAQEAKDKAEENALLVAANSLKAEDAVSKATNAENLASVADGKADASNTLANEAKTESSTALAKANIADQNATEAKTKADQAYTSSSDAVTKSEEAKTIADGANAKALEVENKVGDLSNVEGTPSTVVEAINALRTITGELTTISDVDNTDLATSIMGVKAKVDNVNSELSNFARLTGSQFTGVNTYDGTINSFSGSEIPHAEWVDNKLTTKIGDISSTGITNNATVASSLTELFNSINSVISKIGTLSEAGFTADDTIVNIFKEIKTNLDTASTNITNLDNKVGTLSGTGITASSTVTDALKELKDSITALETKDSDIEGRLQTATLTLTTTQRDLETAKNDLTTSIGTVSNKIGDLSVTGVPSVSNGTVASSIKHLKDRLTTVERADTDITASIEEIRTSKADVSVVETLTEELALVKGATVVTAVITETKAEVEAMSDAKQEFLTTKTKEAGKRTMKNGFVVRTSDGYSYYYFNSTWYPIEKVEVTNASTSNPGLIKYKDQLGYVTTGDGDGTAIVKGFTDLYNQVDEVVRDVADKITATEAESLVDGKVTVLSAKVDGFDGRLTTNETKANTAVNELATLSQTVNAQGRAIESLRNDSIGVLTSTGFVGDNVSDQLAAAKYEIDTKASEIEVNTRIGNLESTGLSDTTNVSAALLSLKELIQTSGGATGSVVSGVDEARLEEFRRQIKQDMFNNGIDVFKYKDVISGGTFTSANYIYRIPGMIVDKRGGLHFVCDTRKTGHDYNAPNEIAYAYSNDGLETLYKSILIPRVLNSEDSDAVDSQSRTMDPTILYDNVNDKIYVLAGCWIKGTTQWVSDNTVANGGGFKYAIMVIGTYNRNTKRYDFTRHTIGGAGCDIVINNYPSNCRGFIGGCAAGIRHSSGKLLMPLQWTTGPSGCKAALLVGTVESNGTVSWEFKYGDSDLNGKSENNVIEDQDGNIIMVVRLDGSQSTPALISSDFGSNWDVYAPYNNKITTQQYASQGSTISFTTLAGKYVVLSSKPQITNDLRNNAQYYRDQLTVYYMSKGAQRAIPLDVVNYPGGEVAPGQPAFGGYSSLCYNAGPDGEKLYIHYEYKLGTQVQDITYLIAMVNQLVDKYDTVDTGITPEQLEQIKQDVITEAKPEIASSVTGDLTKLVNSNTCDWPEDFGFFISTDKIPSDNAFKVVNNNLEDIGNITINGAFLTDGAVNPDRVSLSEIAPGMIKVNYPNNDTDGSIRGNILQLSNATVISLAFNLYIPTQSSTAECCPVIRFFNHATSLSSDYNKGGFEVGTTGKAYITKTDSNYFTYLPLDKLLNIVVEYTSSGATLYVDGQYIASKGNVGNNNLLNLLKSATYMCIGGQGSGKTYTMHVGNISLYTRTLSTYEKANVRWINGIKSGLNAYNRLNELTDTVNYLSKRMETMLSTKQRILNIVGSELTDGELTPGTIDIDPYSLNLKIRNSSDNGFESLSTLTTLSTVNNSSVGLHDGGIYIGQSKKGLVLDLGSNALSTDSYWTIRCKVKLNSNVTQWKTMMFLMECADISSVTNNVNYYRGNSSSKNIRLETSTGSGRATLQFYSGNGSDAALTNVGGSIGEYTNTEEFTFYITCDKENIIMYGKNTAKGRILRPANINIIGFNGGGFGSFYVKELEIIKGKLTYPDEI